MTDSNVIHHSGSPSERVENWYDYFFKAGRPGDWIWTRTTESDGSGPYKTLIIIFPLIGREPAAKNAIEQRGGELVDIYVNRQADDWAKPGAINAWDGNEDQPTLTGSIFIRGDKNLKGWHGFFQKGKLINLDGSVVGRNSKVIL